jgi:hypothetical protein
MLKETGIGETYENICRTIPHQELCYVTPMKETFFGFLFGLPQRCLRINPILPIYLIGHVWSGGLEGVEATDPHLVDIKYGWERRKGIIY